MDSKKAHDIIRRWREHPVQFVREVFDVEPDFWQQEVLEAFPHKNRFAMKACKGPGKTAVLAWCAWNFLCTRPHPKIAATSITGENLSDGLWTEMNKWMNKSEFIRNQFEWTKTRIFAKDHPGTWFMSARTWPKSADSTRQADTLAGLHADYLLFIIDESGGIPDSVMAAAEAGLATGIETKIMQAGNPTHLEGPLYRACNQDRARWFVVEINADPENPNRASRVDIDWARDQIEKYGRDNPWVLVNVFGQFPPSSINTLLGIEEVREAMGRAMKESEFVYSQKRLGIDVARFGDDRTVIFPRQGLMAFRPVEMRNARTTDIAARVVQAKMRWKSEMEFVDDTGHWGHGVIDNMLTAGYSPVGIMFHGKATDPRFKNKRAEMWVALSEWIRRGGCLPNLPEMIGELTVPQYTFNQGKFQLEDKDLIKARLGRSPDLADALALTFAFPEMPAGEYKHFIKNARTTRKAKHDYDPFESVNAN